MPKLTINGKEIDVAEDITLLQACEEAGNGNPALLLSREAFYRR